MIDLKTHVVKGGTDGPHLLITAGVHGDEFEGIVAIHRLLERLDAEKLAGRVTLVPVVNESAYQLRNRCGEDGLDLARTCPGRVDGTQTEQVAHALTQLIQTADLYIDLHAGGNIMDVYPLSGYSLVQNEDVLDQQRRMAQAFNLPVIWGTTPNLEGRSMSVARDAKVPAIYIEYRGNGRCDPRGVEAIYSGCCRVMAEFGLLAEQFTSPVIAPHVYEDAREGSGHMQACYPAPAAGLFEPKVRLGQRVEIGDTVGVLRDSFTGSQQDIAAVEAGAVFVLRTYPKVDQGEALAVVLESATELPSL